MGILDFNMNNVFDLEKLPDNTTLELRIERVEPKTAKSGRPMLLVILSDPTNDKAEEIFENMLFPASTDTPKQANRYLSDFRNFCTAFGTQIDEITDESVTQLVGQKGWVTLTTEPADPKVANSKERQQIASVIKPR